MAAFGRFQKDVTRSRACRQMSRFVAPAKDVMPALALVDPKRRNPTTDYTDRTDRRKNHVPDSEHIRTIGVIRGREYLLRPVQIHLARIGEMGSNSGSDGLRARSARGSGGGMDSPMHGMDMASSSFGPPSVRVEVRNGTSRPALYDITGEEFLIGSVPGCDLRLPGTNLPPVVCLIARQMDGVRLRKLAPTLPI